MGCRHRSPLRRTSPHPTSSTLFEGPLQAERPDDSTFCSGCGFSWTRSRQHGAARRLGSCFHQPPPAFLQHSPSSSPCCCNQGLPPQDTRLLSPQRTSRPEVPFSPPCSDRHVLPFRKSRAWQLREPQRVRTGGQEKRRAGVGQARPPAPIGSATSGTLPAAPPSSSPCFLLQGEPMNREERGEMRKTEAENKEEKERWEGGTTLAFQARQKALGVATFPRRELQLRTPSKVRYHFKLGTRHRSTGLETAAFRLATLTSTLEPRQQNEREEPLCGK